MGGVAAPLRASRNREAYVEQAIAELREWPGVVVTQTGEGDVVIAAGGVPVARLTNDGIAAIHLTRPVIERISGSLRESGLRHSPADEGWATMRVKTAADFDLLRTLTSLAIKANG